MDMIKALKRHKQVEECAGGEHRAGEYKKEEARLPAEETREVHQQGNWARVRGKRERERAHCNTATKCTEKNSICYRNKL